MQVISTQALLGCRYLLCNIPWQEVQFECARHYQPAGVRTVNTDKTFMGPFL